MLLLQKPLAHPLAQVIRNGAGKVRAASVIELPQPYQQPKGMILATGQCAYWRFTPTIITQQRSPSAERWHT